MKLNLKPKAKTVLGALGIILLSMFCLYLIAFSNQITNPVAATIVVVTTAVVIAAIVTVVGATSGVVAGIGAGVTAIASPVVITAGAITITGASIVVTAVVAVITVAAAVAGVIVTAAVVVSGISAVASNWNKNKKGVSFYLVTLLWLVFSLPLALGIVPLSKYHNQNQLERDKKIARVLQITVLEDGIEVLLPSEYSLENSYLEKVFSVERGEQKYPWKTIAIYYQEGKKKYYKAELPFYGDGKVSIFKSLAFSFDHAWENCRISKTISLNSP